VALKCLAADDFTATAGAKTLRCCFAAFEFGHLNKLCLDTIYYYTLV
jgi:hypothetical protein